MCYCPVLASSGRDTWIASVPATTNSGDARQSLALYDMDAGCRATIAGLWALALAVRAAGRWFCNRKVAVRKHSMYPRVCPAHKVVRRGVPGVAPLALETTNESLGEWWPGMTKPVPATTHYTKGSAG
jgi:hypothetical protein